MSIKRLVIVPVLRSSLSLLFVCKDEKEDLKKSSSPMNDGRGRRPLTPPLGGGLQCVTPCVSAKMTRRSHCTSARGTRKPIKVTNGGEEFVHNSVP